MEAKVNVPLLLLLLLVITDTDPRVVVVRPVDLVVQLT